MEELLYYHIEVSRNVSYPPFVLHAKGTRKHPLFKLNGGNKPDVESVQYTVYYKGRLFPLPGVKDTLSSLVGLDFLSPLPSRQLLLGKVLDDYDKHYQLYLLRSEATGAHVYPLGRCSIASAYASYGDALWFTPDSVGLLTGNDDPLDLNEPTYRFFDLQNPLTATVLPSKHKQYVVNGDTCLNDLYVHKLYTSPDHRMIARAYKPTICMKDPLVEVYDRQTNKQQRLYVPIQHLPDSVYKYYYQIPHDYLDSITSLSFSRLRWRPAGNTYRLVYE